MIASLGYIEVDAATETLATTPLHVHRLIARGQIVAPRIGDDGPQRVEVGSLNRYIAAGSPDITPPRIAGVWFDNRETLNAARIADERVGKAVGEAVDKAIEAPASDDVTLRPGDDLRRFFAQSPDSVGVRFAGDRASRFATVAEAYAAHHLRELIRRPSAEVAKGKGALAGLYRDASTYNRLITEAIATFARGAWRTSKPYANPAAIDKPRVVSFALPYSSLITAAQMANAARLAF